MEKNWDETASTSACAMCGTLKKVHYWFAKEKKKQKKKKKGHCRVKIQKEKILFSIPSLFSLVESNIHQLLWLWPFSHTLHNHNHPFFSFTDAWLTKRKRFFLYFFLPFLHCLHLIPITIINRQFPFSLTTLLTAIWREKCQTII